MIACLPMYDWPQVRTETDRLWALIRDHLRASDIAAPDALNRDADPWDMWKSPDLLLGQTCGMPYRTRLFGHVQLVGTPDYGLPDAPPGYYYSQLVVRSDRPGALPDFIAKTFAVNALESQSGWAAPYEHARSQGLAMGRVITTGAHRASAMAVATGQADIAAIDAVTWRLIEIHEPDLAAHLRVLGTTTPTPGLPLITAMKQNPTLIARATASAIAGLTPRDRTALGLQGLITIAQQAYLAIPNPSAFPHIVAAN